MAGIQLTMVLLSIMKEHNEAQQNKQLALLLNKQFL
jgi:hypothetical protein